MRKTLATIVALLALVFTPVLWGLPPPGDQVPAELAWGRAAQSNSSDDANVAKMMNIEELTLEAVATERLATTPPSGGVRLLTFNSALVSADAFSQPLAERIRGLTDLPASGARR